MSLRRGLTTRQWIFYTAGSVLLIAVGCVALLFVFYRPSVEYAFVNVRSDPSQAAVGTILHVLRGLKTRGFEGLRSSEVKGFFPPDQVPKLSEQIGRGEISWGGPASTCHIAIRVGEYDRARTAPVEALSVACHGLSRDQALAAVHTWSRAIGVDAPFGKVEGRSTERFRIASGPIWLVRVVMPSENGWFALVDVWPHEPPIIIAAD